MWQDKKSRGREVWPTSHILLITEFATAVSRKGCYVTVLVLSCLSTSCLKKKRIISVFSTLPGFDIGFKLDLFCLAQLFIYADDGVVMMSGVRTDDLLLAVVPCSSWSSSDLYREQITIFP